MQKTKTVWIGDDDRDDREMICETLAHCPISLRIDCFESGAQLLEKLRVLPFPSFPNIIILDHHMPGSSGLDILCEIKKNSTTSHIPVILMSGRVLDDERKLMTQSGANFIVSKPNSLLELQHICDSICKLWLHSSSS